MQSQTSQPDPDSQMAIDSRPQLWTEKYQSQRFFDLLTDEALNRNVLTWVKSWDEIVFPNRSKVNLSLPESMVNHPRMKYNRAVSFKKVDATGKVFYQQADQEFSYHNKKILTLYGPPGTGKSSLARVIARQSGYEPMEINASEMRSANDLLEAMANSLTQNSHFTRNGGQKPVCLIIDELDGAVSGNIGASFSKVVDFLKKSISKAKGPKTDDDALDSADEVLS